MTDNDAPVTTSPSEGDHGVLRDVRRADVLRRAAAEAAEQHESFGRVGLVLRPFDAGCVAVVGCGELDAWAAARLAELADSACSRATEELVIDLRDVTRCDPDAANALSRLQAAAHQRGTHVELHHPSASGVEIPDAAAPLVDPPIHPSPNGEQGNDRTQAGRPVRQDPRRDRDR